MKRIIKNADIRSRPVYGRGNNKKYSSEGKIIAEMQEGGGNSSNQLNTAEQAGAVAAGAGNANRVWKTDANGNPAWRNESLDGSDKHYTHTQAVPSDTWTITHNLNKRPSITVVDSAGSEVVGDYDYVDDNTVVLTFTGGFAGNAYLN